MPNSKGQWTLREAKATGLPVFDFRRDDVSGLSMNMFTYSEILKLFGVKLTAEERANSIVGFKITNGTRGCIPLYIYGF